jgi:hypothetical protein
VDLTDAALTDAVADAASVMGGASTSTAAAVVAALAAVSDSAAALFAVSDSAAVSTAAAAEDTAASGNKTARCKKRALHISPQNLTLQNCNIEDRIVSQSYGTQRGLLLYCRQSPGICFGGTCYNAFGSSKS